MADTDHEANIQLLERVATEAPITMGWLQKIAADYRDLTAEMAQLREHRVIPEDWRDGVLQKAKCPKCGCDLMSAGEAMRQEAVDLPLNVYPIICQCWCGYVFVQLACCAEMGPPPSDQRSREAGEARSKVSES